MRLTAPEKGQSHKEEKSLEDLLTLRKSKMCAFGMRDIHSGSGLSTHTRFVIHITRYCCRRRCSAHECNASICVIGRRADSWR